MVLNLMVLSLMVTFSLVDFNLLLVSSVFDGFFAFDSCVYLYTHKLQGFYAEGKASLGFRSVRTPLHTPGR